MAGTLRTILFELEKMLAAASLLLLLVFVLVQIVARNFFDTGFPALDILSRHLVLYVAFLGAALITEDQKHIRMDFLAHFFTPAQRALLLRPLSLIAAGVCAVFAWHAVRFWLDEWHYANELDKWVVWFALVLPLGFGLIALHFLMLAFFPARTEDHAP